MAIPRIPPYPMPAKWDLPENRARWRPEAARAALLVHDMQRYFLSAFTPGQPPLTALVRNIERLRERAADLGMPVIYTAQPGGMTRAQRGLLHDFWGPGMSAAPAHRQIVAELAPGGEDTVLTKWRYSAFHRSGLETFLRRRNRDQLIICGIYAHIGCLMTACDALTLDIQSFLVADALADFSLEDHRMALRYAAGRCAVTVPTQTVLDALHWDPREEARAV